MPQTKLDQLLGVMMDGFDYVISRDSEFGSWTVLCLPDVSYFQEDPHGEGTSKDLIEAIRFARRDESRKRARK